MAYSADLYLSRNTDFFFQFNARDFLGQQMNLTGYTPFASYGTSPTDMTNAFTLIAITDPVNGVISVSISAADTMRFLPYYKYLFTVGVTTPGGARINIAEGILHVRDNV